MNKLITFVSLMFLGLFITSPTFAIEKEAGNAAELAIRREEPDERAKRLERYLRSYNSPLGDEAKAFVAAADEFELDWRLVAAIAGVESTFGKRVPYQSYNAWGWGIFTGETDGIHFKNWEDGITQVSMGLRQNYLNRGATTLQQVGRRYAASATWYTRVNFFMNKIEDFDIVTSEDLDLV